MQTYKISAYGKSNIITADRLADFCIHSCGGGYTVQQTAKAMEMQRRAIETGKLNKNITLEVIES